MAKAISWELHRGQDCPSLVLKLFGMWVFRDYVYSFWRFWFFLVILNCVVVFDVFTTCWWHGACSLRAAPKMTRRWERHGWWLVPDILFGVLRFMTRVLVTQFDFSLASIKFHLSRLKFNSSIVLVKDSEFGLYHCPWRWREVLILLVFLDVQLGRYLLCEWIGVGIGLLST